MLKNIKKYPGIIKSHTIAHVTFSTTPKSSLKKTIFNDIILTTTNNKIYPSFE